VIMLGPIQIIQDNLPIPTSLFHHVYKSFLPWKIAYRHMFWECRPDWGRLYSTCHKKLPSFLPCVALVNHTLF
jgi:hypothetical protein